MDSDLHHGGGQVGAEAGQSVGAAQDGVASVNMCPAVLTAEDGPLGKYGKTVQGCGAAGAHHSVGQDPVVEGDVDAVVVPVEGHRLHIDECIKKLCAPHPGVGAAVQDALGTGGQVDPEILDAVLIPAGVGDLSGVDGHGLPQVAGITAQDVVTLL